jgi:hypothetical protein
MMNAQSKVWTPQTFWPDPKALNTKPSLHVMIKNDIEKDI